MDDPGLSSSEQTERRGSGWAMLTASLIGVPQHTFSLPEWNVHLSHIYI